MHLIGNVLYLNALCMDSKGVEILIGQALWDFWIKAAKVMFGLITQEQLGLFKF